MDISNSLFCVVHVIYENVIFRSGFDINFEAFWPPKSTSSLVARAFVICTEIPIAFDAQNIECIPFSVKKALL